MSVGTSHSCAILGDWSMVCWGWDREGQVGNGTQPAGTEWPTPVYVGLTDPLDRPPVADSQTVEVLVGAPETITLSGSDPDGDPLSFAVSTPPTGGTLSAVSAPTCAGFVCTATVVYTPNAGTPGDSFEFTVDDGFETSDPAAVTLPVAGNRTPTANNDPASTLEDTAVDIDAAGNDTDPDDNLNPSSAVAVAGPAKGTLTNNGDGTFTYTPDDNANGTDAFDYQICDTGELCDTATVTITIDPVPDDPIARPDAATAVEDGSVDVDVRFNDSDGDDDPLTVTEVSDPMHGTASLNPDQTVTYASDPDYCGGDTFTYTIDDGTGRTATATVNVDVDCVNDPPTITIGGPYDGAEGAAVDIASTVTDPDSTTNITWTYQTGAGIDPGATCDFADATSAATTLTCDDDGTFTVTATADDGVNPTASARADVVITNQAPRVDAGADQGVNPGTAVTVTATFTDDGSNDSHTARIDWADGNGAQPAAIGPSNTVTATFPGYDNGTVTTVTVEVCDDDLECGTDLVVVTTDLCDIRGDAGPNVLIATQPGQTLCGFGGDDVLIGTFGDETLLGGEGNDTLRGGGGNDILDGGPGARDRASWVNSPGPINANLTTGTATGEGTDTLIGIEDLFGSSFGDQLAGNALVNHLFGQDGNDTIDGLNGDDRLFGGNGGDSISGGNGSDLLLGGDDASPDNLRGDGGNDNILGGPGNDNLSGGDANDTVNGGPGNDRIRGGAGNDNLLGGGGNDTLLGGAGRDNISGGAGNDRLLGQADNDKLNGNSGNDTLNGGTGNDTLNGGTGRNTLNGGPGNDTCSAGPPQETQRSCNP